MNSQALKTLMDYSWPGNVRELENAIERAVVLAQSNVIDRDLLPEAIVSPASRFAMLSSFVTSSDSSLFDIMDVFEKRVILEMLERCGWSQTEAADNFRIPLSTLNQKIKRHGIEIKRKRERVNGVPSVK
jgi:DNA-binding NtrC family response regulator